MAGAARHAVGGDRAPGGAQPHRGRPVAGAELGDEFGEGVAGFAGCSRAGRVAGGKIIEGERVEGGIWLRN